jgi:nicotinamidase/pyrazinamidase
MSEPYVTIDVHHSVLLVVDMQPDFMPGGALPVADGDRLVARIGALMGSGPFRHCAATQDWHPPGHISFASSHVGKRPMDVIDLYGHEQILWPDHCVQRTAGADLHRGMPWEKASVIIRKATDPQVDSYSAFRNNWDQAGERPPTGLAGYLREREIRTVFMCGLAQDFCVKWSAEDGVQAGFEIYVLWDLTRPVVPDSEGRVREDLTSRGVHLITSAQLAT